jgi:hypothetical protein
MSNTPRLGYPYIAENQSQKAVTHAEGLNLNDALIQCTALNYTSTPPGSPAEGDLYLCGASPTGAWSGHAQAIALFIGSAWMFVTPAEGWWCYDRSANTPRYFDGSVWQPFSGGALSAAFTDLTDAPASYSGQASKTVKVKADESGLEFIAEPSGVDTFVELTDVPASYSGQEGKLVRVNNGGSGLEFVTPAVASTSFDALTDTPNTKAGASLQAVRVNVGETALEYYTPDGVLTFLDLSDTPADYTDAALKTVRVNAAGTALEFAPSEVYDVGLSFPGSPTASQVLVRYPFPRTVYFPAALAGSEGVCGTAATAAAEFSIQKNGVEIGTCTFALGASTATFALASETQFDAGDILTLVAPASPDATLADLGLALAGSRLPLDPIPYDLMASIGGTPTAYCCATPAHAPSASRPGSPPARGCAPRRRTPKRCLASRRTAWPSAP